jgi:hypothetical protein
MRAGTIGRRRRKRERMGKQVGSWGVLRRKRGGALQSLLLLLMMIWRAAWSKERGKRRAARGWKAWLIRCWLYRRKEAKPATPREGFSIEAESVSPPGPGGPRLSRARDPKSFKQGRKEGYSSIAEVCGETSDIAKGGELEEDEKTVLKTAQSASSTQTCKRVRSGQHT